MGGGLKFVVFTNWLAICNCVFFLWNNQKEKLKKLQPELKNILLQLQKMEEMPNTTNLKEPRLKKLQKKISLFFYFWGSQFRCVDFDF
jgi:hypothetical protein